MMRHLSVSEGLVHRVPKHHLWVHLTFNARRLGNPLCYQCFFDESLNGKLKLVARGVHALCFEKRMFQRMGKVLERIKGPKRRRNNV